MTKLALFTKLCDVADALQEESARLDFSPHKLRLEQIRERLDVVIDEVLEATSLDEEEDTTHD